MHRVSSVVTLPALWTLGGALVALAAAIAGDLLAVASIDRSLNSTYYIQSHASFWLYVCATFCFFAVWYDWFPRLSGIAYDRRAVLAHFCLTLLGASLLLLAQHFVGLAGLPRHYADWPEVFAFWMKVATIGNYALIASGAVFAISTVYAGIFSRSAAR